VTYPKLNKLFLRGRGAMVNLANITAVEIAASSRCLRVPQAGEAVQLEDCRSLTQSLDTLGDKASTDMVASLSSVRLQTRGLSTTRRGGASEVRGRANVLVFLGRAAR